MSKHGDSKQAASAATPEAAVDVASMSTVELLGVATARPFAVEACYCDSQQSAAYIIVEAKDGASQANAELIRRMAASFEALRGVAANFVEAVQRERIVSTTHREAGTQLYRDALAALVLSEGRQV